MDFPGTSIFEPGHPISQKASSILPSSIDEADAELNLVAWHQGTRSVSTPVYFWEIDVNAVYTHATPDVFNVLGYTPEEIVGQSLFNSLQPEEVNHVVDWCAVAKANHQSFFQFEGVHSCKNGKLVTLETFGIALFDESGKFRGYRGIHRDVSERLQLERTFQQMLHRERWIQAIARIRQSLNLRQILNTTISEVHTILHTDRVLIYRFQLPASEETVANRIHLGLDRDCSDGTESAAEDWAPTLGTLIESSYINEPCIQAYQQGQVTAIADIYEAHLEPWQFHLLRQFQVRSLLIVPILQQDHLWGLLVAHDCVEPREWHPLEIELLKYMAGEVGIAIHQSECYQALENTNRELHRIAHVDKLTEIGNRRCFEDYLSEQWETLSRTGDSMAMILCDVDFFKNYNDTYGHQAGDRCLTKIAEAIRRSVRRSTDLVTRYGGEEFAILLPNTKLVGALQVAKRICAEMQSAELKHKNSPIHSQVTLSLGLASVAVNQLTPSARLVYAADNALYQAKAQGRNRIAIGSVEFSTAPAERMA